MKAHMWGSTLVADGKVYVGDEDGDLVVFAATKGKPIPADKRKPEAAENEPEIISRNQPGRGGLFDAHSWRTACCLSARSRICSPFLTRRRAARTDEPNKLNLEIKK